ncbi:hypothetical protein BC833DRAFT_606456 [Globomyces pollinis-pini]|nr:hypothetical protein BC833DRAFT_606456 [Globomyces pollinis-pini]
MTNPTVDDLLVSLLLQTKARYSSMMDLAQIKKNKMSAKTFVRLFVESNPQCIARLKEAFKLEYEANELRVVNEFITQDKHNDFKVLNDRVEQLETQLPCIHETLYEHAYAISQLEDPDTSMVFP